MVCPAAPVTEDPVVRPMLTDAFDWIIRLICHDKAGSGHKGFRTLVASSPPNFLEHEVNCVGHMFIKAVVVPFLAEGVNSPMYCHVKLMNGASVRKSSIDLMRSVVHNTTECKPMPSGYVDRLRPCKKKLLGWAFAAKGTRSDHVQDDIEEFIEHANGDWRLKRPQIFFTGEAPPPDAVDHFAELSYDLNYACRYSVPVPSRMRGVWESAVEHLLLFALHDLQQTVCALLFGNEDLHNVLQSLHDSAAVVPEGIDVPSSH